MTAARAKMEKRLDAHALGTIDEAVGLAVEQGENAGKKRGPMYEFKFNTAEGRVYELNVDKATELRAWLETMPHWEAGLTMGYLYKRKHGSKKSTFDRRFAVFDPATSTFSYYLNERDAKVKQIREETGRRLLEKVFDADGSANKWWMSFSKRKFMNITVR